MSANAYFTKGSTEQLSGMIQLVKKSVMNILFYFSKKYTSFSHFCNPSQPNYFGTHFGWVLAGFHIFLPKASSVLEFEPPFFWWLIPVHERKKVTLNGIYIRLSAQYELPCYCGTSQKAHECFWRNLVPSCVSALLGDVCSILYFITPSSGIGFQNVYSVRNDANVKKLEQKDTFIPS